MTSLAGSRVAGGSVRHLVGLAGALGTEAAELAAIGAIDPDQADRAAGPAGWPALADRLAAAPFDPALAAYRQARDRLAGLLDQRYHLARAYRSMAEFWADAERQERGESAATYWDSYEHGLRRRLEAVLAASRGCDDAVLTNTGMSALDVAVRSLRLPPGARLLIHRRAYFETSEYFREVLAPTGVLPVAADLTDPVEIERAVAEHGPAAAVVETVLNGPGCDLARVDRLHAAGLPLVVDNSTLGPAAPLPLLRGAAGPTPVLVFESAAKYLTRQASAGVLYGWGEPARRARLTARQTGQQLTGRALHRLRPGELAGCPDRLRLHAERAALFRQVLAQRVPQALVTAADRMAPGRTDELAGLVGGGAVGCLLYVRLPVPAAAAEAVHRDCLARWQQRAGGERVRAGFGWTRTSGRAYGRDPLNTDAGEAFIRLSVGIEPEATVAELATAFAEVSRDCLVTAEHAPERGRG